MTHMTLIHYNLYLMTTTKMLSASNKVLKLFLFLLWLRHRESQNFISLGFILKILLNFANFSFDILVKCILIYKKQ